MTSSSPVLRLEAISKTFQGRAGTVQALQAVDLDIREGEFISFVGPSGCGKTTLLRIIDGLLPADSGRILLDGEQLVGVSKSLAFVFQSINLLPWKTVA
ncbi:MAG: ATP-binding cassette domain-containing protein, partial [bacterium]